MGWSLKDLETNLLIGSTLVEGSTLSEEDAREVLAGRTVAGHPVSELRELVNHRAALEWLIRELASTPYLSVDLILSFHRRLLDGLSEVAGELKRHQNFTFRSDGTKHYFAKPGEVAAALQQWVDDFNHQQSASPAAGAASLYYEFAQLHPFDDGNGRVGRALVTYWLHWKWQRGWRFVLSDKSAHLDALHAANVGEMEPLVSFFRDRLLDVA